MSEIWNFTSLKILLDERHRHQRELRQADQKALDLALQRTDDHFEQLNENAKRTIEERGHFVSKEAFDPFRDEVRETLTAIKAENRGVQKLARRMVTTITVVGTLLAILVVAANFISSMNK